MTTLLTGIPRLDALVRAEAARLAAESAAAHVIAIRARHLHDAFGSDLIAALPPGWVYRDSHEVLLRNLTRPESRDWAVRAGLDLDCNAHPEQGPFFDGLRDDWNNRRDDPTALAQALAAVCRDG